MEENFLVIWLIKTHTEEILLLDLLLSRVHQLKIGLLILFWEIDKEKTLFDLCLLLLIIEIYYQANLLTDNFLVEISAPPSQIDLVPGLQQIWAVLGNILIRIQWVSLILSLFNYQMTKSMKMKMENLSKFPQAQFLT